MSLALPPSALSLHAITKMQGEKEGWRGGGGLMVLSPRHPRTHSQYPDPSFLPPPAPPFLLHLAITPEGTIFFTFTNETVCYVRVDGHYEGGGWRIEWSESRPGNTMRGNTFYPSILCDGPVSVFVFLTVGAAERMGKNLHLD